MLPSALEACEIEVLIYCLDHCLCYHHLTPEQASDAESAREKLLRYLRDECGWHGIVA